MPTREIGTRFKLEGEQAYKKAMTDAASAVKTLNAEEKLAEAQFEATGDAQQYAADQARILKEKIEEQKKAVAAAEEAVRKLTENGIDKNSTQMQKWRTKLVNAQTSLKKTETRLQKVETELKDEATEFGKTETAAGTYQDQMEKVNKGIDFQNTIMAIDNITGHIETVIKTAAKAAKAVWDMGVDAGNWADNISTEANKLGVDPETYQSWQYASRFIDTSVEDIQKSWQDIQKKLDETNLDYLGNLAQMGVASMTTSGKMRSASAIFWDAIDYLHGISDESARAAKATELFGNDWRKLNPLIEKGSKAYFDLADEGRSVAVVSNENVAALAEVDDAIQDMSARFDKLKYDTMAELAPTFKTVAEALSEAITAMDEFVQSEEGRAALQGLNEALTGVINSFLGTDNGKGTFKAIVEGAKEAVTGFTGAMEWIQKNGWAVTGTIAALGIAWTGLKVTKEVLTFAQLLSKITGGGSAFSKLFGGKSASADSLTSSFNSAAKTFDEAAKSAQSAADAAKSSADAAKSSSGAASSSAGAAETSSGAASSSATAAESSSGAASSSASAAESSSGAASNSATAAESSAGAASSSASAAESSSSAASNSATAAESSAGAASSSAAAAEGSASAAASSADAALSSASAVGNSVEAAANSALAAAESALGAAEARAALEAGAAGALESAAGAAAARIQAETAAQQALEAAARANLNSGASNLLNSGNNILQKLLGGNGVNFRFTIPLNPGSGSGSPVFPNMLQSGSNPLALPSGSGSSGSPVKFTVPAAAAKGLISTSVSTLAKLAGGLGLLGYMTLKPTHTVTNDLDQLWDEFGNPTTAGRDAGITWKQSENQDYDAAEAWNKAKAEQEKAAALEREQKAIARMEAAQNYWDAWRNPDTSTDEMLDKSAALKEAFADDLAGFTELEERIWEFMASGTWETLEEVPADLPDEWFIDGQNAAIGLANGIDNKAYEAINAARAMAAAVSHNVRETLMIQSPSRVMENLGEYTGLGFAEGIENSAAAVDRAVGKMVSATARRPMMSIGGVVLPRGAAGANGYPGSGTVHVTLMLDDEVLGDVMAPIVNEKIGAQINAVRR